MSYGMTVSNASGFVQIAEPFDNVSVFLSGTATTQQPGAGPNSITLPPNTPEDIIVFAKPSIPTGVYKFAMSLIRFTEDYTLYFYDSYTNTGQSIDYILLTKTQALTVPSSGYGVNIYNSSGNLAFTSEYGTSRVYQSRVTTPPSSTFVSVYPNVSGELLNNTWAYMNAYGFYALEREYPSYTRGFSYKVKFDFTNDQLSSLVDSYGTINFGLPVITNYSTRVEMLARF